MTSTRFAASKDTRIIAAFIAFAWALRLYSLVREDFELGRATFALLFLTISLRGLRQVVTHVTVRENELVATCLVERIIPHVDVRSWTVDRQGLVTLRGPFGLVYRFETALLGRRGALLAHLAARLGAPEFAPFKSSPVHYLLLGAMFAVFLAAEWERYRQVVPGWFLVAALAAALVSVGLVYFKRPRAEQRFVPGADASGWSYLTAPIFAGATGSVDSVMSRGEALTNSILFGALFGGLLAFVVSYTWFSRGLTHQYFLNTRD